MKVLKQTSISITVERNNEIIVFHICDEAEKHEYSSTKELEGYIDSELKYKALGEFQDGSDDLIEITEIESV